MAFQWKFAKPIQTRIRNYVIGWGLRSFKPSNDDLIKHVEHLLQRKTLLKAVTEFPGGTKSQERKRLLHFTKIYLEITMVMLNLLLDTLVEPRPIKQRGDTFTV